MTAPLIAPVIPLARRGRQGRGTPGRAGMSAPPPLANSPTDLSEVPADLIYGAGRLDASGRVSDRAVTSALGWNAGDRLMLTIEAGMILARRDPRGMVTLPARPFLVIPAALRRRCGLRAGDLVLLAAVPEAGLLRACPLVVAVQALLRADVPFPVAEGDQP